MKKSLEEAMDRAKRESQGGHTVYVMDKKWERSVICCLEWVKRERILEGWKVVAEFQNGKKVR